MLGASGLNPEQSRLLEAELARDEGEVLHAYSDSEGYLTIGIGRLIDKRRGGGISHEEAIYLLRNDIADKVRDLDGALPWWRSLSPVRQRVLVNMCFNLGLRGLLGFKNTLAAMEQGRYEDAAKGMRASKWSRQVGERAERLAEMIKQG